MAKALEMVRRRRVRGRIISVYVFFIFLVAGLAFIPWQQTIEGMGQVMIFKAMDRPQEVSSPIPARLVEWKVQEGDVVKAGDVLVVLEDVDSKFLDTNLVTRLTQQKELTETALRETERRVTELNQQRTELEQSRTNAIAAAEQLVEQSQARLVGSRQLLAQARRTAQIARQVATRSAAERTAIQADRVVQADQAIQAATQQAETMRLRRDRIKDLEGKGLRSRQDLELAENEFVKAETEVVRAKKAKEIALRDQRLGDLGETQAEIEARRAEDAVEQAKANLAVAERDVANAKLNLNRLSYDTAAAISRVNADVLSARESMAKNGGEIQKVENELANLKIRTGQQVIKSPATGRVARLTTVGAGAILKSGDVLATIVPTTPERRVELFVTDNDIPWISVGRPVRMQFAGFPAIQLPGFPGSAVGTYGGRVALIDPVDDGTARYRVIIEPEIQTLPSGRKDDPWPSPELLRPGAEAYGWVLLDTVPLGFELWRQFNGFPPNLPKDQRLSQKKGTSDKSLGPIKVKTK